MENKTQERRDRNYNVRMDWWNEAKGPKGPIQPVVSIIIFIGIIFVIGIIGAIITEIFK